MNESAIDPGMEETSSLSQEKSKQGLGDVSLLIDVTPRFNR